MLTFRPIPKLDLSIGNSIIYAEQSINPLYLIPIAFYKAFDKGATRGLAIENQNSQIFVNFSSRNIKHLHLYFSAFIDEVSFRRFLPSSAEKNPISYKIGANITNFPLQNFAFTAELTRTNIITYKHSIEALTWENNSIGLGGRNEHHERSNFILPSEMVFQGEKILLTSPPIPQFAPRII